MASIQFILQRKKAELIFFRWSRFFIIKYNTISIYNYSTKLFQLLEYDVKAVNLLTDNIQTALMIAASEGHLGCLLIYMIIQIITY
jgi:hypothetical protein